MSPANPPRDPGRDRDAAILTAARGVRGVGAGALSVVLAIDLARSGYPPFAVGVLLGVALGGGSAWALAVARWDSPARRRRWLATCSLLLAAGGFLLWVGIDAPLAVLGALLLGGIVASSSDVSPLGALEQATLVGTAVAERRTARYGVYNLVGYLGLAGGALLAGPVGSLSTPSLTPAPGSDAVFLLYALLGLGLLPLYLRLGRPDGESAPEPHRDPMDEPTRSAISRLAGLFSVDAFAGGLVVNSLVAYYFATAYHPSLTLLGKVFFLANVAAAASLLLAAPLARRFGLLPTMVFTHLPSSVLLAAVPFAPTFLLAAALWVARSTLSQLDVPTRQSYVQAIVPERARTAAAAYTTAARSGQAFGAPVTGAFLAAGGAWLAGPFVLAGAVKVAYDLALYRAFRHTRPPEERRPRD